MVPLGGHAGESCGSRRPLHLRFPNFGVAATAECEKMAVGSRPQFTRAGPHPGVSPVLGDRFDSNHPMVSLDHPDVGTFRAISTSVLG